MGNRPSIDVSIRDATPDDFHRINEIYNWTIVDNHVSFDTEPWNLARRSEWWQDRSPELDVLVAEATAAGIHVMSHAQATQGIRNAVEAGIRSIEHGIYLDDEAIQLMLDNGTWLVPTLLAPRGVIAAAEAGVPIPPSALAKAHDVVEVHMESISKAIAAGVKVAMGTDCPVSPHGSNLVSL